MKLHRKTAEGVIAVCKGDRTNDNHCNRNYYEYKRTNLRNLDCKIRRFLVKMKHPSSAVYEQFWKYET